MDHRHVLFFSLLAILFLAMHGAHAVVYSVTNNAGDRPGGHRFNSEIGEAFSLQTLSDATNFIWNLFEQTNDDERKSVPRVSLVVESMNDGGVTTAFSSDNVIHLNADYVVNYAGDVRNEVGGLIYESMTYTWMWDGNGQAPNAIIGGIADFVRLRSPFGNPNGARPGQGDRWDQGYDVTAQFLAYCDGLKSGFVADLNRKMEDGYSNDFFSDLLGKTVDELWSDYKRMYGTGV